MAVIINSSGDREHWTNPIQGVQQSSQGNKTVGNATVQLTSVSTPCDYIRICAPTSDHTAGVNTSNILIGTDDSTNVAGGVGLAVTNYEGVIYPVRNANLVYLTGFTAGDSVEYQIFKY